MVCIRMQWSSSELIRPHHYHNHPNHDVARASPSCGVTRVVAARAKGNKGAGRVNCSSGGMAVPHGDQGGGGADGGASWLDAVAGHVDALCAAYSERIRQVHRQLDSQEDPRERTARQTAAGRALWAHVIQDPLANILAGEAHLRRLQAKMTEASPARDTAGVMLAVRTLWFDVKIEAAVSCCLQSAVSSGPVQVVFLGAGMDTRAYRLKCLEGCAVFEVDLPRIVDSKRALLDAALAGGAQQAGPFHPYAASVERVAADLASDEWWEKLHVARFQAHRDRPCVWVLEGLLYYLHDVEARALLTRISGSCARGTWLLADFMNEFSTHLGSELQTHFYFHSDWPEELLPSLGFGQVQVSQLGDPDANFGLIADHPLSFFHRLRHTPRYSKSDADGNPCRRLYLVQCRVA